MDGWISIVVAAISGGAVAQILNFFLGNKKEKRDKYSLLFDRLEKDNDRLRNEQEKQRERSHKELRVQLNRIVKLEKTVTKLHLQIVSLESAHYDHPYPSWLKDVDGVMLYVNRAYEEVFLSPYGVKSEDYVGHTDFEVWPEDIARQFVLNDQKVIRSKQTLEDYEDIQMEGGEMTRWRIIKYPRFSGRRIIGIAGMAIPILEDK